MIRLYEGTKKYLLIHPSRVERNAERAKVGDPVVVVVEETETGNRLMHRGYSVLTEGPASIAYSQRDPLFKLRYAPSEEDVAVNAAYVTTSAVLLAETPDEPLSFAEASTTEEPKTDTPTADTKKGKKA